MHTTIGVFLLVLIFGSVAGVTLRDASAKHGIYVGSARNYQYSRNPSDPLYNSVINSEYNLITAENACKWGAMRPSQQQFDFTQCDFIAQVAANASAAFRGHNLCWGDYNPGWLTGRSWSNAELTTVLQTHIKTVLSRYSGRAICWDVVNEAVNDNPSPGNILKHNVWYPTIPNYIDVAFQAARATDSKVKLFYNDYSSEGIGGKSDAVYNLVKDMKSRGIPIDGVGLQMHVSVNYYPPFDQISANIKRLGDLGLEVQITEMDVSCPDPCNSASQQKQADIYAGVLKVCLSNPNCKNFETWGFTDLHTWLGTNQHPLPFDQNYQKKTAYNSILNTLLQ